jgi:hypothetical protein
MQFSLENLPSVQEKMPVNWIMKKPPVAHVARDIIQNCDARRLWHLPTSISSVFGNAWVF